MKRSVIIDNIRKKKAQESIGMSFSVIFSLFLIVFILVIGFIAIKAFLDFKKCGQIGNFIDDFSLEVDNIWNSQTDTINFSRSLPNDLEYVCFADLTKQLNPSSKISNSLEIIDTISSFGRVGENMFLYPIESSCEIPNQNMKHLDIEKITQSDNPYCIPVKSGRININLEKKLNERLVIVR